MIVSYVTFDPATGELLGGFMQEPPDDGTPWVAVDNDVRIDWPSYRMNSEHLGVERIPPVPPPPPTRDELKQARQSAVDAIAVTVNGKVFDGDETSQTRMVRALKVSDLTGQASCTWVLRDNSAVTVTKAELEQALVLAMQAQAAIWVIPA